MCGRYQFTAEQGTEMLQMVREIERRYGPGQWRPGEIRPSSKAPVLVEAAGEIVPELMRWGYRCSNTLVINARAETALEKPMFRESVRTRRCLIPSSGFYEWDADKRKYLFRLPGEPVLTMAGLYERRGGELCYCILTTAANSSMRPIHGRMPLVVSRGQAHKWLRGGDAPVSMLSSVPPELEVISAEAQLRLW